MKRQVALCSAASIDFKPQTHISSSAFIEFNWCQSERSQRDLSPLQATPAVIVSKSLRSDTLLKDRPS